MHACMHWVWYEMGYCYADRCVGESKREMDMNIQKMGNRAPRPRSHFDLGISRSGGKRNGLRVAAQML